MIHRVNEENILQQLVLNESSYVRQHFEKSIWYEEFVRDLRFSDSCYFVGYSLKDYHISSILLQDVELTKKTFFVTPQNTDNIFKNRIRPYGTLLPIGLEKFADYCLSSPSETKKKDIHSLRSFRLLDPFKDKKSLSSPTSNEILHLVTYGTFNYQRCLSTLPNSEYVVSRQSLAEKASNFLETSRCLLVHSFIGNGKTIFLHILAHKLSSQGHQCILAKTTPVVLSEDIQLLRPMRKLVIFFDSYNAATDLIPELSELLPDAKFVIAVRTGIQEVRLHEIENRFPRPIERINLNGATQSDLSDFKYLLDQSGVRAKELDKNIAKCKNFREVVTMLYNHSGIRKKMKEEMDPLLADLQFRRVFIATHLLKWAGHDVDAGFLRSVTGCDAYAEIAKFKGIAGDIFRLDDDSVQVRSSVFSEYLIKNLLKTEDIVDGIYSLLVETSRRKGERRYQGILGSLMRFSRLSEALSNDGGRYEALIGLYERLKREENLNREPLFWLQYSILMTAVGELEFAEELISTAYTRAAQIPTFKTFQIDTYSFRLLMLSEGREVHTDGITRFDEIVEKLELVKAMISDDSHRGHAIQVLREIEPFVSSRRPAFSASEKNIFLFHLILVDKELERLSEVVRLQTGSDEIRKTIERARQMLLS